MRDGSLSDYELLSAPSIPDSQATALTAARAALEKQAEDVAVLDLRSLSSVTDFFVVCTADSSRQVDAIRRHIEDALNEIGGAVWHTEGSSAAAIAAGTWSRHPQWLLMDCGEVVVHLLDQPTRSFYRLEELWADAPRIPIPSFTRPSAREG